MVWIVYNIGDFRLSASIDYEFQLEWHLIARVPSLGKKVHFNTIGAGGRVFANGDIFDSFPSVLAIGIDVSIQSGIASRDYWFFVIDMACTIRTD